MTAFLTKWLWQIVWAGPLLLAALALPVWPWSRRWGIVPAIGLTLLAGLMLFLHAQYIL